MNAIVASDARLYSYGSKYQKKMSFHGLRLVMFYSHVAMSGSVSVVSSHTALQEIKRGNGKSPKPPKSTSPVVQDTQASYRRMTSNSIRQEQNAYSETKNTHTPNKNRKYVYCILFKKTDRYAYLVECVRFTMK